MPASKKGGGQGSCSCISYRRMQERAFVVPDSSCLKVANSPVPQQSRLKVKQQASDSTTLSQPALTQSAQNQMQKNSAIAAISAREKGFAVAAMQECTSGVPISLAVRVSSLLSKSGLTRTPACVIPARRSAVPGSHLFWHVPESGRFRSSPAGKPE